MSPSDDKAWQLIEKLSLASVEEQRRARRWGVVFKSLTFLYLFVIGWMLISESDRAAIVSNEPHTALIRVDGIIADGEPASADRLVKPLRDAFKHEHTKAVLLAINSPGGSPVQAGYIYDEIVRLRDKYPAIKIYSAISDTGASGAYYIAAATDEIYADKASLVGSIGVISSSFGFVEAMDKVGVERRVFTAGENKAFLDPFLPLREQHVEFWETVLKTTHEQFIEQVKKGRGGRLKADAQLFSGRIWSGEQALELGLIDGLGSPGYVAREVVGEDNIVDFSLRPNPLEQLIGDLGVAIGQGIAAHIDSSRWQLR